MTGIAPDGSERRWVLVCQGNNPEIICAKLLILLIGRTETSFTFHLVSALLEASSWWDPSQTPAHPSVTELTIFTLREKRKKSHFPSPSLHAGKEGRTPEIASDPTSCCSYSPGRGRETQVLTVPLRKAFPGHIKDKLSHHSSEAGKGDNANQLSTPHRPPVPFPP